MPVVEIDDTTQRPAPDGEPLPRWEHFAHGADIGVRGRGASLPQAFAAAAVALTAVVADPQRVRAQRPVSLQCEAPDAELLLADWLNAVVYAMAKHRMLFSRFEVRIEGDRLHASAWGEPVDPKRHEPAVEVKGATYTALRVQRDANGVWTAQTVVDV